MSNYFVLSVQIGAESRACRLQHVPCARRAAFVAPSEIVIYVKTPLPQCAHGKRLLIES